MRIRTIGAMRARFLVYFAWTVVRRIARTVLEKPGNQHQEAAFNGALVGRLVYLIGTMAA